MNKYFELAKEFYPHIKADVNQAILMGPSLKDHTCDPKCEDCQWYNWGLSFMAREKKGEFSELNI